MEFDVKLIRAKREDQDKHALKSLEGNCMYVVNDLWVFEGDEEVLDQDGVLFVVLDFGAVPSPYGLGDLNQAELVAVCEGTFSCNPEIYETPSVQPEYESLHSVLTEALEQAQAGKGKDRHADGQPFEGQPIMWIADSFGEGYQLGQAVKKLHESQRLPKERAIAERLGAINYIAASILRLKGTDES